MLPSIRSARATPLPQPCDAATMRRTHDAARGSPLGHPLGHPLPNDNIRHPLPNHMIRVTQAPLAIDIPVTRFATDIRVTPLVTAGDIRVTSLPSEVVGGGE